MKTGVLVTILCLVLFGSGFIIGYSQREIKVQKEEVVKYVEVIKWKTKQVEIMAKPNRTRDAIIELYESDLR